MPAVGRSAPRDTDSHVQSVIIDRAIWTEAEASRWISEHGFITSGLDVTENFMRFRQFDPEPAVFNYAFSDPEVTILPAGIRYLFGFPKD